MNLEGACRHERKYPITEADYRVISPVRKRIRRRAQSESVVRKCTRFEFLHVMYYKKNCHSNEYLYYISLFCK